MNIKPFLTEQFFALYEFTAPHVLASSDCETLSIGELLALSGGSLEDFGKLELGYTETQGHPEYRQLVADMYENVANDEVVILTSPVEGIYLTMQALLGASDEVVALSPAYDALHHVADHLCGKFQRWHLVPTETGWEIDLDRLKALVNPETRLIIVNFPHNPSGFQPGPDAVERLIDIARANDCWLFCDEIYRGLETRPALESPIPSAADVYEKAIVLNGLSKTFGLPGLRAGWLIVRNTEVREQLMNWKHYTTICPAAPTEYLAMQALSVREELAERSREIVRANLSICGEFMQRHSKLFRWRPPIAGSTALVEMDLVQLGQNQTRAFANTTHYCHDLAQNHGVLLLPGECLGCSNRFVRMGLGRTSFPSALTAWESTLPPMPATHESLAQN